MDKFLTKLMIASAFLYKNISVHIYCIGDAMEKEILRLKKEMKNKKRQPVPILPEESNFIRTSFVKYITKLLITVVITLVALIALKSNTKLKTVFYKQVYDTNFSFASINNLYQKYFGSPIPFKNLVKDPVKTVFDEKLNYKEISLYKDGAKLTVAKNYLVPILESGMVVFIGEKEGYGHTIIIQQVNGVDTWYGNVTNDNVKLYDYVSKGSLLAEAKEDTLYMVFQKEGKKLDYKKYLK